MANICSGCKVWGFFPHACDLTVHIGGHDHACACSVYMACAGWCPPPVQAYGVTVVHDRDVADSILRGHVWSREADPVCIRCGVPFNDIRDRGPNLTPACHVTPDIFKGLRP